jgi:Arc/MetJ-type ribon-helix-helix transcriptional regulator
MLDRRPQASYAENRMEVAFTPDQKAFIRRAIESGRLAGEEDAVREALSLWEDRERRTLEILIAVDKAEASLARGEGRKVTTPEQARQLAVEVKRRAIARLNAEQNPRP